MDDDRPGRTDLSRRSLLIGAGAGGLVLGAGAATATLAVADQVAATSSDDTGAATAAAREAPVVHYRSTVAEHRRMEVTRRTGAELGAGLIFATPRVDLFKGIVADDSGNAVWIEPDGLGITDLRVQTYRGEPHLTYWTGTVVNGYGVGRGIILDDSYRTVAEMRAGDGLAVDLHEFQVTDQGTVLLTSYPPERADLSSVGGPADGWLLGARVREVDIATGDLVMEWNALDDIRLSDSYQTVAASGEGDGTSPENAWDPVHVNSVDVDAGGATLIVSARHTHTIYGVERRTGRVLWRLGGRRSDYRIAPEARFAWQHDVRRAADGTITVFDNHSKTGDGVSAGLRLAVDEDARTVRLDTRYAFRQHQAIAMGNVQDLPNGNVLVGWGTETAATEFSRDGRALFELELGGKSYRTFRQEWSATPAAAPDVAIGPAGGGLRAFASWNGATEVARWRFVSGSSASSLDRIATVPCDGFETSVGVAGAAFAQAIALDADGRELGRSRVVAA